MVTHVTALPLAAEVNPAGGAEITQIIIATGGALVATAVLFWLALGHRSGRVAFLGRIAAFTGRASGMPGWVALPAAFGGASLLTALFGMYWDISLHIDNGRDAGPLANPAHYFILAGLFGIFAAGVLAAALPEPGSRPGPRPVKILRNWYAPVGSVVMIACAAFSLIGFPLDDVWHRLFGQDVTLWGPTHLMLLGGAAMTLVSMMILLTEGTYEMQRRGGGATQTPLQRVALVGRRISVVGGLLIGLTIFSAEYDFGVAQFQLAFYPLLMAMAAAVALVAARLWIGPGATFGVVAFYLVVRGGVAVVVSEGFGQSFATLPLFIAEAVIIEAVALVMLRRNKPASPLAFGAVGGLAIGTLGFAAEYAWTQVAYKMPYTTDLLPEGVIGAVIAGVGGGLSGALLIQGIRGELPRPGVVRTILATSWTAFAAFLCWGLITETPKNQSASFTLTEAAPAPDRTVNATVRFDPELIDGDPAWVTMTAWQGREKLFVDRMERVADGVWRTTRPAPVSGTWKTLLRVHDGRKVLGVPVFLPEDPAIKGGKQVPATAQFTRAFVRDTDILQREKKPDTPGWLWTAAALVVAAFYVIFLIANAVGVGRVGRAIAEERAKRASETPVEVPPREAATSGGKRVEAGVA